jgi:hypothetical protein
MIRVLNEAPIPPDESDPRIPKDLVRIIGKAMARQPDDRYPNARSLAVDLERFAQGRSLEIKSTAAFKESTAARFGRKLALYGTVGAAALVMIALVVYLDTRRKQLEGEKKKLEGELRHAKLAGLSETAKDLRVDVEGIHASQDRDIRARIAMKALTVDATDANSKKSVEDMLARARASAQESPTVAGTTLRQALALSPHRWDIHLELARTIAATEADEAENELTMCVISPEASRELQLAARLERGRLSRSRGDPVSLWLGATDLKLVQAAGAVPDAQRVAVAADLAFALAETGEVKNAEKLLADLPAASGDELARVALARAALARAKNDAPGADAELARARDAAATDETKRLVDVFNR